MSNDAHQRSFKCSSRGTLTKIPGLGLKLSPSDRGDIESLTGFDLKIKVVVPNVTANSVESKPLSKKNDRNRNINSNDSWNSRNASMNLNSFVSKSVTRQNMKKDAKRSSQDSSIDVRVWT